MDLNDLVCPRWRPNIPLEKMSSEHRPIDAAQPSHKLPFGNISMYTGKNMEGRTVARLRDPATKKIVGLLIQWETGEINPLWLNECDLEVSIEWLPDEEVDGFDLASL